MSTSIKKLVVGSILGLALLAATADRAEALGSWTDGYICTAQYFPTSMTESIKGSILVTIYSSPRCTGTYHGFGYFYPVGSTDYLSNPKYLYSQAQMNAIFGSLQRAVHYDRRVGLMTQSSKPYAITNISFMSYL